MFKINKVQSEESKSIKAFDFGSMTSRQLIPRKIQSSNVVIPQGLCSYKVWIERNYTNCHLVL